MGAVLSKIKDANLESVIKLWLRSNYFRVAIVTITFLIARRVYNKCYRMYNNLPLDGPTGLPFIGSIPHLLLNLHTFINKMSEYGPCSTYNVGLKSICFVNDYKIAQQLIEQSVQNEDGTNDQYKLTQTQQTVEKIITEQLDSKMITDSVKELFENDPHFDTHQTEESLHKNLKFIILNTVMIITFGVTLNESSVHDEFYEKWDAVTHKMRDHALNEPALKMLFGDTIFSFLTRSKVKNENSEYVDLWKDIFNEFIKEQMTKDTTTSKECIFSKMSESECESDLFVIMSNAMNTTAASLRWCIHSLCQYPKLQKRIFNQVVSACGGNMDNISLNGHYLKNISFLKAFIYDNMRLYPLGSIPQFRKNSSGKPIKINLSNGQSYSVPADGCYHINLYALSREQEESEEMDENSLVNLNFWLDEHSNFSMNETLSAIGFGKRKYVGKVFAIKALQLILSLLVFKYKFEFVKNADTNVNITKRVCDPTDEEMKQIILSTPSEPVKCEQFEEVTETIDAQKGSKEIIKTCSSKKFDFGNIVKTDSNPKPLQVAIEFNLNASDKKQTVETSKETEKQTDAAEVEDEEQDEEEEEEEDEEESESEEETDEDELANLTKQDVEYERSFIKDLSVNPFGGNLFGTPKKRKFSSAMLKIESADSAAEAAKRGMRRVDRRKQQSTEGKKTLCRFFGSAKGCESGKRCPYSHSNPNSVPMCKRFRSRWGCKFGYKCRFRHKRHLVQSNRVTQNLNLVFDEDENVQEGVECKPVEVVDEQPEVVENEPDTTDDSAKEEIEAMKEEEAAVVTEEAVQKEKNESSKEEDSEIDDKAREEIALISKEAFCLNKEATEFVPHEVAGVPEPMESEEAVMSIFPESSTPTGATDKIGTELQTLQKFNALPEIEFIGNVVDKPENVTLTADGGGYLPDLYGMQQPYYAQMIPAHFFFENGQLPQNSYIAQIHSPEMVDDAQSGHELLPMFSPKSTSISTMPPIEEDIEFEEPADKASKSKLNKEAPVFVPTVAVISPAKKTKSKNRFNEVFTQYINIDYQKAFSSDISSNPFAKSPFSKNDFWKRKAGRLTVTESDFLATSRKNSDNEQEDGSISDEITDKTAMTKESPPRRDKNALLETMQTLSDHSTNITDSNTSSNDDEQQDTSDEDKEILDDSSLNNKSILMRIEKKLREIDLLESKQMNGAELKDDEMIKVNRKAALTQKLFQLQHENSFAVNEWQKA